MSKEIMRATRDAILADDTPTVRVPDPPFTYKGEGKQTEWSKVLGALAATYHFNPDPPHGAQRKLYDVIATEPQPMDKYKIHVGQVRDNISRSITARTESRDIGEVVTVENNSHLPLWALHMTGGESDAYEPHGRNTETKALTAALTKQGIETYTDFSMGVAAYLTELFCVEETLDHDPAAMRELIVSEGLKLFPPVMRSPALFDRLQFKVSTAAFLLDREISRYKAREFLTHSIENGAVTHLDWQDRQYTRTPDAAGCPFLAAEQGKLLKPAWNMTVDLMWPLVEPRLDPAFQPFIRQS